MTDSRDASNMNPRSRESPTSGYPISLTNGYGLAADKRNISDEEDNAYRKQACDSHSLSFGLNTEKTFTTDTNRGLSPATTQEKPRSKEEVIERTTVNGTAVNERVKDDQEQEKSRWNKVTSTSQNRITRVSPDSQSERISATDSGPPPPPPLIKPEPEAPAKDYRDYLT